MKFICCTALMLVCLGAARGQSLVWSDEFDGPAGAAPDSAKWNYDVGATGWGNRELEEYTRSTGNAFLDGKGNLVIRAAVKPGGGYTSARLKTEGKFTFTYGKVEARMKIPYGQGIWPAFWLLGEDIPASGWPRCGEIDIMENIGKEPSTVHGTLHGPGYSGAHGIGAPYGLEGARFADDFHVYSVVWKPESIEWFVDGHSYHKVASGDLPTGAKWVYQHPFFLILNLAVGGAWPGNPDASTQFPQDLVVDYVRVYR